MFNIGNNWHIIILIEPILNLLFAKLEDHLLDIHAPLNPAAPKPLFGIISSKANGFFVSCLPVPTLFGVWGFADIPEQMLKIIRKTPI